MKERYEFVAPCHFGLEAVTKREIGDLGYEIVRVEDGKVTFAGDLEALARSNIFCGQPRGFSGRWRNFGL